MCSNGTYLMWFMYHKTLKPSDLTQIDAKAIAMSLTCILEIYLTFKARKGCKFNHFRFWKIKKGSNEEMSKSRLMDYEEREDKDIMSLEAEKWPLWSKKEGKKIWIMRHEASSSSCMEVWNSKSSGNMYSDFEVRFGVLPKVHFGKAISFQSSRSQESNALNGVQLELKQRSHDHLKATT